MTSRLLLRRLLSTSTLTTVTKQQPTTTTTTNVVVPFMNSTTSKRWFTTPGVGKGKTSTGLVGLPVDHDAISKIIIKYTNLLQKVQSSIPPTSQYRINIEKICNHRIKVATAHPNDPDKVEELCNCGQVEELVQQADDELMVMEMYIREKWWEKVKEVQVEVEVGKDVDGGHGDVEWDAKV